MKQLFTLLLFGAFGLTYAQTNTFPNSGNVGIGTSTPTNKLEVIGNIKAKSVVLANAPTGTYNFIDNIERTKYSAVLRAGYFINSGNTGSRTLNLYDFPQSNMNNAPTLWFSLTDRSDARRFTMRAVQGAESNFIIHDKNQATVFNISENGQGVAIASLPKLNSYLTIGTDSYSDNGVFYKLSVNGKVRANEVKVYTDWADYVFSDDYDLPTLEEVEEFIDSNGHLMNIPSAENVEKNGVELGEMNKLLLEKIEELTLYVIELKKDIEILKSK